MQTFVLIVNKLCTFNIFQIVSGLEKYRGDNCIYVWDLTRSAYSSSGIDVVTNYDRRSVFPLDASNAGKPLLELGIKLSNNFF